MALVKHTQRTSNFFTHVTVTSSSFSDTFVQWDFVSQGIALLNLGVATNIIEYSFNGTTVHGDLDPSTASAGIIFDNRGECCVYLRLKSGTTADVRIEAWAV